MQVSNQQNNQIYITKEVFIDHLRSDIDLYYDISLQALGEGGFSQVFQAKKKKRQHQKSQQDSLANSFSTHQATIKEEQTELNNSELRAIKVIQYEKNSDKQRMANEIQILSYLDHPNILKLYETIQSRKRLYLVTDILKGGDLNTVIDNRRNLSENDIKIIFRQLVKALNYLHSQKICHRDLKPQNILFLDQESFNISIIDFGLAFCWEDNMKKQLKKTGQNKKIVGTVPEYMSPQIIARNYDQKCDIWSIGVILYELLFKKSLFQGNTQQETFYNIRNFKNSFKFPDYNIVSEEAKDLISKILVQQNQRVQLIQILSHSWFDENECSCQKCSIDEWSTISNYSQKKSFEVPLCQNYQKKFKKVRSQNRVRKESCIGFDLNSYLIQLQNQQGYQSEDLKFQEKPQQLSVDKIQYFCSLSKFQKLMSLYAVSRLSQSKTKKYANEFLAIDRNLDGTISLQDLTEYLFNINKFQDKQKIQYFFNGLSLSHRDYISYSQYLACVLSYSQTTNYSKKRKIVSQQEDQFDQRFTFNCMFSAISDDQDNDFQFISDNVIEEFFYSLDKDKDGLIEKQDFVDLLEVSNIVQKNTSLIKEVEQKFEQVQQQQKKQSKTDEWTEDPRKFKRFLSRTYKGQKDGGTHVNLQTFKSWVKNPKNTFKQTIL